MYVSCGSAGQYKLEASKAAQRVSSSCVPLLAAAADVHLGGILHVQGYRSPMQMLLAGHRRREMPSLTAGATAGAAALKPIEGATAEPAQKQRHQQLSKADLVAYIASGCKPREKWG